MAPDRGDTGGSEEDKLKKINVSLRVVGFEELVMRGRFFTEVVINMEKKTAPLCEI